MGRGRPPFLQGCANVLGDTDTGLTGPKIAHAFDAGSNAAEVLVAAYVGVRATHLAVYFVAATGNGVLRSVIRAMAAVTALAMLPLVVGGPAQKWWWLAGVAIDQLGVYFVRFTRWQLSGASHVAERFGFIILIALGESIVDLGVATTTPQLGLRTAVWSAASWSAASPWLLDLPQQVDPLVQLVVIAVVLVGLVAWEVRSSAAWRAEVRAAQSAGPE